MLGGRSQRLTAGASWAQPEIRETLLYDYENGFPWIGDFRDWDGDAPVPVFDDGLIGSDIEGDMLSGYLAAQLNPLDALSVVAGLRVTDWESNGQGYGEVPERQLKQLKLSTRMNVPQLPRRRLPWAWQSEIGFDALRAIQDDYAVLSAFASCEVNHRLTLSVSGSNLTDEKYLNSLYWTQANHAAPANATRNAELEVSGCRKATSRPQSKCRRRCLAGRHRRSRAAEDKPVCARS